MSRLGSGLSMVALAGTFAWVLLQLAVSTAAHAEATVIRPAIAHPGSAPTSPAEVAPASKAGEADGGADPWLVAVASAFGGALITLVGDRSYGAYKERRTLTSLLNYVRREIADTRRVATQRGARSAAGPFPFDSRLATSAWDMVCASEVNWRLIKRSDVFEALTECYDAIEEANHQREVAVTMFTLAQSGRLNDDEARYYIESATQLVSQAYPNIESKSLDALNALDSRRWGRR